MELPSLLSLSLLGEVLFLGRRLHEQHDYQRRTARGTWKIFDLLKMKTKMKMGWGVFTENHEHWPHPGTQYRQKLY